MGALPDEIKDAALATFCVLSAPIEAALQLGTGVYGGGDNGPPSQPSPGGLNQITALRDSICNEVPRESASLVQQPFSGGQCKGVVYNYSYDFRRTQAGSIITGSGTGQGEGPLRPGGTTTSPGIGGQSTATAILWTNDVAVPLVQGSLAAEPVAEYTITSVSRADGMPDDCGNPPPIPPEFYDPNYWSPEVPVTYDPPTGSPVTITPVFIFAPVKVDVDGRVTIPTTVRFDTDVDLFADIDLNTGDVNFRVDVDVLEPTPITDPTIQPNIEPPVPDPEEPLEPIAGKIIGVRVSTTQVSPSFRGTEVPSATAGTRFYVPRMGSVSFLCEQLGGTGAGWTEDISVKYEDQVIECPVEWGAIAVAATAEDGISWQVSLITGESPRDLALRAAGVE